jgi:hypothetical protein
LRRFAIRTGGNVKALAEAAVLSREIAHWGDKDTVFLVDFFKLVRDSTNFINLGVDSNSRNEMKQLLL